MQESLRNPEIPVGNKLATRAFILSLVLMTGGVAHADDRRTNLGETRRAANQWVEIEKGRMDSSQGRMDNARFKEASAYDQYIGQRVPVLRAYYEGKGYRVTDDVLRQQAVKELTASVAAR